MLTMTMKPGTHVPGIRLAAALILFWMATAPPLVAGEAKRPRQQEEEGRLARSSPYGMAAETNGVRLQVNQVLLVHGCELLHRRSSFRILCNLPSKDSRQLSLSWTEVNTCGRVYLTSRR